MSGLSRIKHQVTLVHFTFLMNPEHSARISLARRFLTGSVGTELPAKANCMTELMGSGVWIRSIRVIWLPCLAEAASLAWENSSLLFSLVLLDAGTVQARRTLLHFCRSRQTPETCMIGLRGPTTDLLNCLLSEAQRSAQLPHMLCTSTWSFLVWEPAGLHQRRDWMWETVGSGIYYTSLQLELWWECQVPY